MKKTIHYKVFAWGDAENGAWFDPEFLRLYEDRGQAVRFSEGSRENLQVIVIPPRL